MAKILEQNEIDQLFSGEVLEEVQETNDVKAYDFRHPDRLSKEQNRLLNSLMENFCRFTATYISASTRSLIEMQVSSIDQLTYNEYMFSINEPVAIFISRFKELGGRGVFEFSTKFILFIVDRLLGGNGTIGEEERQLTAIEQRVALNVIEKIFSNFAAVWKEVYPFSGTFESYESNPRLVQIAPPGESVILISVSVNIEGKTSLFNICVPFIILQQPLRNLTSRNWKIEMKDEQSHKADRIKLQRRIQKVKTELSCILGTQRTTMRKLLELQDGDTLRLEQRNDKPLTLKIGNREKFFVEPGILGERKAVKIIEKIK